MKLGLISDLHGDPASLEMALGHLESLGADRIICAGDLVGYGPMPDEVVTIIAERQIAAVRGNHDRWAISRSPGSADEFGGGTPSRETLDFLKTLPPDLVLDCNGRIVIAVHGSPDSDMEYVTKRTHAPEILDHYLTFLDADLLVVGHTHEPLLYECERGLVINPGSLVRPSFVRSSQTFALVDLTSRMVSFYDVRMGKELEISPW